MMFRGSSFHSIDPKGRIIVPARFREAIKAGGENAVMVSQLDGCLLAYPLEEWAEIEKRILAKKNKTETIRRFRRIFIGGAAYCACDKQERILIPPPLRQYAALEKDIVLVGVLDHFEIWSRENWDKEHLNLEEDMKKEAVGDEIAELGL
jgi:MraZ protein